MNARECHGLSERRACGLIYIARRVARYQPSRSDDARLPYRLREWAAERRWFGYRRPGYLLAWEGVCPNHKKLLRIYRGRAAKWIVGLKVRRHGGRKRALVTRVPMTLPQGQSHSWSLDFVFYSFGCGRSFCVLCMLEGLTRKCLALVTDTSLSGQGGAGTLRNRANPWQAASGGQRQRHGTDIEFYPALVAGMAGRMALYRLGQADSLRVRREPQRPAAG